MAKKSSKANSATDKKVRRVRNIAVISCALIVGLVVGYGILYSTGLIDNAGSDGFSDDYTLIESAEPRRRGSPVVVSEYFSYGCIHCKSFDPLVQEFKPSLPSGSRFDQVPVTFNPSWSLLARAHLALRAIDGLDSNHDRLFNAIHNSNRQFTSAEQLADFVDGKDGVTKKAFLDAYNSSAVRRRLGKIDADLRTLGITSVPSLIVDGRYKVDMSVGRKQSLEVARHLVDKVLAEDQASTADGQDTAAASGGD